MDEAQRRARKIEVARLRSLGLAAEAEALERKGIETAEAEALERKGIETAEVAAPERAARTQRPPRKRRG